MLKKKFLKWLFALYQLPWYIMRPVTAGVKIMLVRDRRVLLVKHSYQDEWYLVGGGCKRNETLEQAARREAREEVGAELGALRLFGVYTGLKANKTDQLIVFVCEDFVLSGRHDWEIERYAFFDLDQVPADASPPTKRRIQEYLACDHQPAAALW